MHPGKRRRKNASAMKLVGSLVARFRKVASLTQAQLADHVCAEPETIASIEQGRRPLKPDLARQLDDVLDTKGALEVAVDNMPEVDLIPSWAGQYMDLENEALTLSWFENQILPGLLQTEPYARAIFENRVPVFSAAHIERQTIARMERQEILRRESPPTISFVVWEPVLQLRLLDDEGHADQLRHIRSQATLPGICFQVLPLACRTHAALDGPFILVETPDYQHVAYSETQRGSLLVSDPPGVSILTQKFAMLRAQALNPVDSVSLLNRLLGER